MSKDIVVESQRDIVLDFGPVTRRSEATGLPVAIDLSLAGTKMWFTVKANMVDIYSAAVVKKTYVQGGAADGFTVTDPTSTDSPNGTVTIARGELPYTSRQSFYYDLTIEEPGGRRTTLEKGAFKVVVPVTNP